MTADFPTASGVRRKRRPPPWKSLIPASHTKIQTTPERFPRTQKAIGLAASVADATIFTDNSRGRASAFTVCRIQIRSREVFDIRRTSKRRPPREITDWLDVVSPIDLTA